MGQPATIAKPAKPRPDFPLFAHATRRWAKKIRGRLVYFGPWSDPEGSLRKYLAQKDDLHAGRTPRPIEGELLVRDVLNHFLTAKQNLVDSGEITQRTWSAYYETCNRIKAAFGGARRVDDLRLDDFAAMRTALAKRWGPVAIGNEIQRVRCVFKYAYDAGLIEHPMRFGPGFKRPSKKVLRQERAKKGKRMFQAAELRKIIKAAKVPLKAMVLLGINCGFGNADCGSLPLSALDLDGGWHHYHRPKTGIQRRCPLWPETIEAIKAALKGRRRHKDRDNAGLVFITKFGFSWNKQQSHDNPITREMIKLLRKLKLHRPGLGFYALRHTTETIGGEVTDQVAVDFIMGHSKDDMASVYREQISDDRLRAVTEHIHKWLFASKRVAKP